VNVAIIPARGGSKRIPRKNLLPFCGKPIIQYSIDAALESGCFNRVIVSTDDDEIAQVAASLGAETPFTRPRELSDDHTPTMPVIAHAIEMIESDGALVDYACCIYATAPFIAVDSLKAGLRLLQSAIGKNDFAFPVTTFPFPIKRALRIRDDGAVEMMWPEHEYTRSQDLEETFHDAGQFYWGTKSAYQNSSGFYSAKAYPIPIPRHMVQDIDTFEDWERAERMFLTSHQSQRP